MRVIAGRAGGIRLNVPKREVRPTMDRVKAAIFSSLGETVIGARVLDLFAGTGGLGIEALSRGAEHVTFVESDRRAQALIAANLAHCRIETGYTVLRVPVARGLEQLRADPAFAPFDIMLFDPPYDLDAERALAGADAVLASGGVLLLEHARARAVPVSSGRLVQVRQVRSGDSTATFYELRN